MRSLFLILLLLWQGSLKAEDILQQLFREIKCPVCQGQSIGDSEAPLAYELRSVIVDLKKSGYSKNQIHSFLREKYGDSVLFEPPYKPHTWFLWWAPGLFVMVGMAFFLRCLFQRKKIYS